MHLEKKQCDLSSLERLILTLPHIYPAHCVTQGGQREKTNIKKTPQTPKNNQQPTGTECDNEEKYYESCV